MERIVQSPNARLSGNTTRAYDSGKCRYLQFCSSTDLTSLPCSESTLCWFVPHLVNQGLHHSSVSTYQTTAYPSHLTFFTSSTMHGYTLLRHTSPGCCRQQPACFVFFLGFLYVGEFIGRSALLMDPNIVSLGNVAHGPGHAPPYLRIHLQLSKTDPFKQGVIL